MSELKAVILQARYVVTGTFQEEDGSTTRNWWGGHDLLYGDRDSALLFDTFAAACKEAIEEADVKHRDPTLLLVEVRRVWVPLNPGDVGDDAGLFEFTP